MSWKITPSNLLVDDADALAYLTAVEAADTAAGQSGGLESGVRLAVNAFVKGCKADGIWPAIKASCILAGARTLQGALVPLVGAAPTNVGPFVAGDYNRETGLVGDGSTKYLNSNRAANADPLNNFHASVFVTAAPTTTTTAAFVGETTLGVDQILSTSNSLLFRCRNVGSVVSGPYDTLGLVGFSRSSSLSFLYRDAGATKSSITSSTGSSTSTLSVFARGAGTSPITARMAFYSIGESLNLALLDSRVTTLINAIAAAIP